jgi:catechol 2,3-dioxygenase-like lactoylglutathione lyase family enzyme
MAVIIEFVDLIIPIITIERCAAIGGFQGFLREEAEWVGKMIWWDDHICRVDGSMSSNHVPSMIKKWEQRGLQAYSGEGNDRKWSEFCVVDAWKGSGLPCPWLAFDKAIAWHSGFPRGNALVGPPDWFSRWGFMGPELNLVVIRVSDLERAGRFYEALGLRFSRERHGNGPEHLATKSLKWVFEIYPQGSSASTAGVVIGFHVESIERSLAAVQQLGAELVLPPANGPWGLRAVVRDPDGHRVELSQTPEVPA